MGAGDALMAGGPVAAADSDISTKTSMYNNRS